MSKTLEIVRANYEARQKLLTELRTVDETAEGRAYTEDETTQVTELRSNLEGIDTRIQENLKAELRSQEIADATGAMLGYINVHDRDSQIDTRSIGERFINADGFSECASAGARGSFAVDAPGVEMRAVTDTTTGSTSGGAFYRNQRLDRVGQDFLDRRTYLIDLLPVIPISTGVAEYVQDKSPLADMANKGVEVTEGSAKPQAGITTAVVTEASATVAAWANLTRQVAADGPQVKGYLDGRLRYSLKRRTDLQSISGNGTAPNLKGLLNRTGIVSYAPGSAEARYVSIRHGIRLMEDLEAVPEIIVLNPADAELFDLSNSTTAGLHADGNLANGDGNLANAGPRTAWGLTQVRSTAIASGTAMLVDPMHVAVLDREQPAAYMTDSHASNFTANILTLLLELRLGLALFDPAGVCSITFNGTT
jgi:HK97 family phage major capsid protein